MGNRVAKTVVKRIDNPDPNNSGSTMPDWDSEETTLYVRDASGNVMATYTLEIDPITDEPIVKDEVEYTIYGSSRLGITTLEIDEQIGNNL